MIIILYDNDYPVVDCRLGVGMLEVEGVDHQGLREKVSVSYPVSNFFYFLIFFQFFCCLFTNHIFFQFFVVISVRTTFCHFLFSLLLFLHEPHGAAVKVDKHPLVWVHVEALSVLDLKTKKLLNLDIIQKVWTICTWSKEQKLFWKFQQFVLDLTCYKKSWA